MLRFALCLGLLCGCGAARTPPPQEPSVALECGPGRASVKVDGNAMCVSQPYADFMTCPIPQALKQEIKHATSEAAGSAGVGVGGVNVGIDAEYKSLDTTVKQYLERSTVEQEAERLRVQTCAEVFKKQVDHMLTQPQAGTPKPRTIILAPNATMQPSQDDARPPAASDPRATPAQPEPRAAGLLASAAPTVPSVGSSRAFSCEGGERWLEVTDAKAQFSDGTYRITASLRARTAAPVRIAAVGGQMAAHDASGNSLRYYRSILAGWNYVQTPSHAKTVFEGGFPVGDSPSPVWLTFTGTLRSPSVTVHVPLLVAYRGSSDAAELTQTSIECEGIPVLAPPLSIAGQAEAPTPEAGPLACQGLETWLEVAKVRAQYSDGMYRVTASLRGKNAPLSVALAGGHIEAYDSAGNNLRWYNSQLKGWNFSPTPSHAQTVLAGGMPLSSDSTPISFSFSSPRRAPTLSMLADLLVAKPGADGNAMLTHGTFECANIPVQ